MSNSEGRKTDKAYWNDTLKLSVRARLPSRLNVTILNITRLLKRHVRPGSRYIEIGCAPGKTLEWVASVLKAEVAGIDYSEPGIAKCRDLFETLRLKVNLYHDDIFDHHLPLASFDVVTSFGVIEHFENAQSVVQIHLDLLKPSGLALITVPNYGGIYGSIEHWCNAPSLALHNMAIMNPHALLALADLPDVESARAQPYGAISPWILSLDKKLPHFVAKLVSIGVNAIGLLQPLTINALAPMLLLEVRRRSVV